MDKNKKLMIIVSALSILTIGLCFGSMASATWFPPGAGVVP